MVVTGARHSVATPFAPSNAPGAIAIVQIRADDETAMDCALVAMGLGGLGEGAMTVRRVLDVDECVVVRWSGASVHVMPHAGRAVMRAMIAALEGVGIGPEPEDDDPRARFPESADLIDACLCDALWRAQSPRAIAALTQHAARWRAHEGDVLGDDTREARELSRLIEPALVVGWGAANVGKSSLLNALARRSVSIVADRPGTTRDHVGVTLELDGVAVRWIDAPGLGAQGEAEDRSAMELARVLASSADLIILMGDAGSGFPEPPGGGVGSGGKGESGVAVLKCGLRDDLGHLPGGEVSTSVLEGRGLGDLAIAVRERLVGRASLETQARWRFSPILV